MITKCAVRGEEEWGSNAIVLSFFHIGSGKRYKEKVGWREAPPTCNSRIPKSLVYKFWLGAKQNKVKNIVRERSYHLVTRFVSWFWLLFKNFILSFVLFSDVSCWYFWHVILDFGNPQTPQNSNKNTFEWNKRKPQLTLKPALAFNTVFKKAIRRHHQGISNVTTLFMIENWITG